MNLSDKVSVTVHSLLYILNKLNGKVDFHKVFKILYFAEREHLSKFGTLITDNEYIAMNNGPVPSLAYDILKSLRGVGLLATYKYSFTPYFNLTGRYTVECKIDADLDEFSQSEIKCLNNSIDSYGKKSFTQLTVESHDYAWKKANRDCEMSLLKIAKSGGATGEMMKYIQNIIDVQTDSFV